MGEITGPTVLWMKRCGDFTRSVLLPTFMNLLLLLNAAFMTGTNFFLILVVLDLAFPFVLLHRSWILETVLKLLCVSLSGVCLFKNRSFPSLRVSTRRIFFSFVDFFFPLWCNRFWRLLILSNCGLLPRCLTEVDRFATFDLRLSISFLFFHAASCSSRVSFGAVNAWICRFSSCTMDAIIKR